MGLENNTREIEVQNQELGSLTPLFTIDLKHSA